MGIYSIKTKSTIKKLEMNYFNFKSLVNQYRSACKVEITGFALKYNFICYTKGESTPLLEKMEIFFDKPLSDCILRNIDSVPKNEVTRGHVRRKDFTNIQDDILDIALNGKSKQETSEITRMSGKEFFIDHCRKHGQTLFRVRLEGEPISFCCICKYGHWREPEITQSITEFLNSLQTAQKAS